MIYTKFVCLYQKHLFLEEKTEEKRLRTLQEIEEEKYSRRINEQHKYLVTLRDIVYDVKNTIDNILEIEFCIGGEIPYMTVKNSMNGNVYEKKVFLNFNFNHTLNLLLMSL